MAILIEAITKYYSVLIDIGADYILPKQRKKWILIMIFFALILSMIATVPSEKSYNQWLVNQYNLKCTSATVTRDCTINGQAIEWKDRAERYLFLYKKTTDEYSTNKGNLTIDSLGIFGHYFDISSS